MTRLWPRAPKTNLCPAHRYPLPLATMHRVSRHSHSHVCLCDRNLRAVEKATIELL